MCYLLSYRRRQSDGPIQQPGGRVLVRMPRSLHRDLVVLAEGEGVSLNQFLVSVLARAAAHAYGEETAPADGALADAVYQLVDAATPAIRWRRRPSRWRRWKSASTIWKKGG